MEERFQDLKVKFHYMDETHEGNCYICTPLEEELEVAFICSVRLINENFKKKNSSIFHKLFSKRLSKIEILEDIFSKEDLENKRFEIIWIDSCAVHVTIRFAEDNCWNKKWFQKFLCSFYRTHVLRMNGLL